MPDMYNTSIPAILAAAMENASAEEARNLFDDADFCGRKLLEGLISTGRLLSGMSDSIDPQMWELRSLGDSIAVTAELVAWFNDVAAMYHQRMRKDATSAKGGRHA